MLVFYIKCSFKLPGELAMKVNEKTLDSLDMIIDFIFLPDGKYYCKVGAIYLCL